MVNIFHLLYRHSTCHVVTLTIRMSVGRLPFTAIIACYVMSTIGGTYAQSGSEVYTMNVEREGDTFQLNCGMAINRTVPRSSHKWILPRDAQGHLEVVSSNGLYQNVFTSSDGWSLTVSEMTSDNIGLYHCMVPNSLEDYGWELVRIGVNVKGPFFQNSWDMYRTNTMVGLISFFGTLAFICGVVLIYRARWEHRHPYEVDEVSGTVSPKNTKDYAAHELGQVNPVYDRTDEAKIADNATKL